jgi:hypothetical protein
LAKQRHCKENSNASQLPVCSKAYLGFTTSYGEQTSSIGGQGPVPPNTGRSITMTTNRTPARWRHIATAIAIFSAAVSVAAMVATSVAAEPKNPGQTPELPELFLGRLG